MKRLLWMTTIFLALMSCRVFADTIIKLFPNDCWGDNFAALQRNGADRIGITGGTNFYNSLGIPPGSTFGAGSTELFIDSGGFAEIAGQRYTLQQIADATISEFPSFTFPTNPRNGQLFQVPVEIGFFVPMLIIETGEHLDVSGSAAGHWSWFYDQGTGLYYPSSEGFQTPEPSTFGLIGTGLLGVLTFARGRLRSR
jgi:hypothetical protein